MSVTERLAAYVVDSRLDSVPRDVQKEATRALVNYLGCALGGSIEPALDVAIEALAAFSGERKACVLAATQAAGIREMFGSMAKSFQPGRAAQNGYTAALLGRANFTAGERALEGPRGFAAVTAARYDLDKITANLGVDFELRDNAYKPYACGLVVHPAIDGCVELHRELRPAAESIASVRVRVAPLVLDLCNKQDLRRALESKYSIYHACAIGLVRGKGGLNEFTEDALADPELAHVRGVTTAIADPAIKEDQAHIEVTLRDGRKLVKFVEQSLGNVHRPLSDAQLTEKFVDQAVLALPRAQVDAVLERCRPIGER